jgi:hypothetical protein
MFSDTFGWLLYIVAGIGLLNHRGTAANGKLVASVLLVL